MEEKLSANRFSFNQLLNETFNVHINVNSYKQYDRIFVYCEVQGSEVYASFKINIDIFNSENQLVATQTLLNIQAEKFDGIASSRTLLLDRNIKEDYYFQVYPSNSYLFSKEYNSNQIILIGLDHEGRREYVNRLVLGDVVNLIREKDNPYDSNAIKVLDFNQNHIGYIKKECAIFYKDRERKISCVNE